MKKQNDLVERIKSCSCDVIKDNYAISAFDVPELRNLSDSELKEIASKFDKPMHIFDAFSEFDIPAFMREKKQYVLTVQECAERKMNPYKFVSSDTYVPNDGSDIEKREIRRCRIDGKMYWIDSYQKGKEIKNEVIDLDLENYKNKILN